MSNTKGYLPSGRYVSNDVTNDVDEDYKFYHDLTESSFKQRFRNHIKSFNRRRYQNGTELSNSIWTLKLKNKTPSIRWKIIQVLNIKIKLNFCKLCLTKKYYIINALGNLPLPNKRSDFVSNCRHKRKLFLKFLKDSKD